MWYHLSNKPNIKILKPHIPACALPDHEDRKIPRICFSNSIEGCLSALDASCKFYVYTPIEEIRSYKPTVDECRDARYTGEIWVLESTPVKCIGKIDSVYLDKFERHNSGRGRVLIYKYKYKWLTT